MDYGHILVLKLLDKWLFLAGYESIARGTIVGLPFILT